MTVVVEDSSVRRSKRIQERVSSQPVIYDEDEIERGKYGEYSDYEDDLPSSSHKRNRRSTSTKGASKRSKTESTKTNEEILNELRENYEESYMFEALNDPEASISELAQDWVDSYKSNSNAAKKDLINLILNTIGCYTRIEEHDVSNNESAADTVGEIQTFFKRQNVHENYLSSRKPAYKHLRKNLLSFIEEVISISDENGLLYANIVIEDGKHDSEESPPNEGSILLEDLLIWLSSFSVSSVRPMRFVSTVLLFTIETTLCRIIVKCNESIKKFKHQLESEQRKKASKNTKKKLEQIETNLTEFTNQYYILENFIQDILNTTFIHRFKDIDHTIRAEAMAALGDWIDHFPEMFFKVTYLKYLGWVLSDEHSSVRLQVIKTLTRLLKTNVMVSGLRQFLERFKSRLIEIGFFDVDSSVRLNAIALLIEVNKTGFLEDQEIVKISQLLFIPENSKMSNLISRFIHDVETERTKVTNENLDATIEESQEGLSISLKECIKFHHLIDLVQSSYEQYKEDNHSDSDIISPSSKSVVTEALVRLFKSGYYDNSSKFLMEYYLIDFSSIDLNDEEILESIAVEENQENCLLDFIYASLIYLKDNDSNINKKKVEGLEGQIQSFITLIPKILKKTETNDQQLSRAIEILLLFPVDFYELHNQAEPYKLMMHKLVNHLKNNSIHSLKEEYSKIFETLSSSKDHFILNDINSLYEDAITEIVIELKNYLNDPGTSLSDDVLSTLDEDYITKLLILGKYYDINEVFITWELFKGKLLVLLPDFKISVDKENAVADQVTSIIKLFISATSSKLNLLLKTNENRDLEKELKCQPDIVQETGYLFANTKISLPLKFQIALVYIDLVTILKTFFDQYEESGKSNLQNANRSFDIDFGSLTLSKEVNNALLELFLYKESSYANLKNIHLDRDDDENVNFNSLHDDVSELDRQQLEGLSWYHEKDLVLFISKLVAFSYSGLLGPKIMNRIKLNKDKLGPLYRSVFDQVNRKHTANGPLNHDKSGNVAGDEEIPEIAMED